MDGMSQPNTFDYTRPPAGPRAPKESAAAANAPAAPVAPPVATRRLLDTLSSAERKEYPMATGLLDYFPDALAEVSHVSYLGNQKHNPGQPLHWSRDKSADHADCAARHMSTRADLDGMILHLSEAAWRVLAELQLALETKHNLSPPAGAIPPR
jgi:hypothetical protein